MSDSGVSARASEPVHHSGGPEHHSIDFIPLSERRGRPRDLLTLWFSANTVFLSIEIGGILVAEGFGFLWAALAIVIGVGAGTFFAASHSAQGPTLGVPQMLQSRAQFGYLGGVVPMAVAEITYVAIYAANPAVAALLLHAVFGLPTVPTTIGLALITFMIAIWGYDLVHQIGKLIFIPVLAVFLALTVLVLTHTNIAHPDTAALHGSFNWGLFLGAIAITFIYQATYGVYMADYSRYLPADVSRSKTALWSYIGLAVPSLWLFLLGAYLTVITGYSFDVVGEVNTVTGNGWFSDVFAIVAVSALLLQSSLSLYVGGTNAIAIVASLKRRTLTIRRTLAFRLTALVPVTAVCIAAAVLYATSFEETVTDILNVLIVLLVPWSAVNLVDFYIVRKGRYSTQELFNPKGQYGVVNWAGLISFLIGVAAAVPFANFGFWAGPATHSLDGGDLSWLVGIVVAGGCYLLMTSWGWQPGGTVQTAGVDPAEPQAELDG